MKAYSFRLATVVKVRRVEVALARQKVAQTAKEVVDSIAAARILSLQTEAIEFVDQEFDSASFRANLEYQARLARMLAQAVDLVADCRARHLAARQAASAAERRLSVLERLDDRRRKEWILAALKEDAAVLDDIVTTRTATARLMRSEPPNANAPATTQNAGAAPMREDILLRSAP